jgi:hypothetical protein
LALGDEKKQYYSVSEMAEIDDVGRTALLRSYKLAIHQARLVGCGFIAIKFPNRSVRPIISCMGWSEVIAELTRIGALGRMGK